MVDHALPAEVRDLVRRRLRNMEEIEVLLLLSASPRSLTAEEICAGLRIPPSTLPAASIDRLVASDLVDVEVGESHRKYRYAPGTPELRKAVTLLAVSYNERPVTLVRLVYNRDDSTPTFAEGM